MYNCNNLNTVHHWYLLQILALLSTTETHTYNHDLVCGNITTVFGVLWCTLSHPLWAPSLPLLAWLECDSADLKITNKWHWQNYTSLVAFSENTLQVNEAAVHCYLSWVKEDCTLLLKQDWTAKQFTTKSHSGDVTGACVLPYIQGLEESCANSPLQTHKMLYIIRKYYHMKMSQCLPFHQSEQCRRQY